MNNKFVGDCECVYGINGYFYMYMLVKKYHDEDKTYAYEYHLYITNSYFYDCKVSLFSSCFPIDLFKESDIG